MRVDIHMLSIFLVLSNWKGCDDEHVDVSTSTFRPLEKALLSYGDSWEVCTPSGGLGCFGNRSVPILDALLRDD